MKLRVSNDTSASFLLESKLHDHLRNDESESLTSSESKFNIHFIAV